MSEKIEYTDEPVCPHCGESVYDAWDYDFQDDVYYVGCPNCDKPIEIVKNRSITYNTYKN
jgi:DNA-directed RNA polymerase subunit RPC12/RpoP